MSELLLPVGNMEMALAAIHNGADAVYMGFPHFNARGRSHDFEIQELRDIIEVCHLYGVRAHLAFNILIFPREIEAVIKGLDAVLPLKPDALIIQDLGLAKLVRQMAPDQVIHGSTQMTVTNGEAIHLVEDLNIRRFVLGRENSISEIQSIQQSTQKDLEIFVHGALCVSYSGQCFTSESIGGRSANRGQCAQSCRFGYQVFVDGEPQQMLDKKYVVSPSDLCGIAEIPELIDIGVSSFKIEGRLKSPEYVASATQEYRQAIDRHLAKSELSETEVAASRRKMSTTYSRGFFPGWLHGVDHQRLVEGTGKAHRGMEIGVAVEAHKNAMTLELSKEISLSAGDGLLFLERDLTESGAQIYDVRKVAGGKHRIEFGNDIDLSPRLRGARIFLNSVAAQKKELRKSFQDRNVLKHIDVSIRVAAKIGHLLVVEMSDGRFVTRATGKTLVEAAQKRAVDDAFFKDELGALGATPFALKDFKVERADSSPIFYSHRELKEIRRELSQNLEKLRRENRVWGDETPIAPAAEILEWSKALRTVPATAAKVARLNILLREKSQVLDLVEGISMGQIRQQEIDCVILDFEFGADYEASLMSLKAASLRTGIATTRILKPKEYMHFVRIERLNPDVILIRNLGALYYFTKVKPFTGELRGDFSLNVTNHLTAHYLIGKGLTSVTASYDLNSSQVTDLLRTTDASKVEVTIHQYMPAFHMEHCVFAALLSKGSSFRDCGKPCEKHRVELQDEFGNRHQIKADPECRNTMFNAVAQSAAAHYAEWNSHHLGAVRFEALFERGQELIEKIASYQSLIMGQKSAPEILSDLGLKETYGLGEGPMAIAKEYRSIKKSEPPTL
jgi:putative protease